jgi:hypothetical protein
VEPASVAVNPNEKLVDVVEMAGELVMVVSGGVMSVKVAVTLFAAVMVTMH